MSDKENTEDNETVANPPKEQRYVSWEEFGAECYKRFDSFQKHPILSIYFFIVVVAVGSSGIWVPFIMTKDKCFVASNVFTVGAATYCIALLAASMADNLLSEKLKTIRFLVFGLFLLSFTLSYVTLITNNVWVSILALLLSLLLWVINYSEDETKMEARFSQPNGPAGGPTDVPVPGTLEGFTTT